MNLLGLTENIRRSLWMFWRLWWRIISYHNSCTIWQIFLILRRIHRKRYVRAVSGWASISARVLSGSILMKEHDIVRWWVHLLILLLLAEFLQETCLTCFLGSLCFAARILMCRSSIVAATLLVELILSEFEHLLQIFETLLESLCPTWDTTRPKSMWSLLSMMTWRHRCPYAIIVSGIEVIVVCHVQLLWGCQVDLRLMVCVLMIIIIVTVVTTIIVMLFFGCLVAAWRRLLGWLSRLVVIVVVRGRHVACSCWSGGNIHMPLVSLTMYWCTRAWI